MAEFPEREVPGSGQGTRRGGTAVPGQRDCRYHGDKQRGGDGGDLGSAAHAE
jgi:hypothetical protein